jgi:hypothetical protein
MDLCAYVSILRQVNCDDVRSVRFVRPEDEKFIRFLNIIRHRKATQAEVDDAFGLKVPGDVWKIVHPRAASGRCWHRSGSQHLAANTFVI